MNYIQKFIALRRGLPEPPAMDRQSTFDSSEPGSPSRRSSASAEAAALQMRPWINEDGEIIWSPARIFLGKIVFSKVVENTMMIIIIFNLAAIIYETNEHAKCYPTYSEDVKKCPTGPDSSTLSVKILYVANMCFLIIYSVEAAANLFVSHCDYFRTKENILDFCICVIGWASEILGSVLNVSWLRILRIMRLFRGIRIVMAIPELYMLCLGFLGSMRAMFFGALLLVGMLFFSSILIVQNIHPLLSSLTFQDCPRCSRGFSSIQDSILTLFQQIVAGDSWGLISIPVIEEDPILGMILPITQLAIGLGTMNLILAVVVDHAVEARESNQEFVINEKLKEKAKRTADLCRMFNKLDVDGSGCIDKEELESAFQSSARFRQVLELADVGEQEMFEAFELRAADSGLANPAVSIDEICSVIDQFQSADLRKTTVLCRMKADHLEKKFECQEAALKAHAAVLDRIERTLSKVIGDPIYNQLARGQAGSHLGDTQSLDFSICGQSATNSYDSAPITPGSKLPSAPEPSNGTSLAQVCLAEELAPRVTSRSTEQQLALRVPSRPTEQSVRRSTEDLSSLRLSIDLLQNMERRLSYLFMDSDPTVLRSRSKSDAPAARNGGVDLTLELGRLRSGLHDLENLQLHVATEATARARTLLDAAEAEAQDAGGDEGQRSNGSLPRPSFEIVLADLDRAVWQARRQIFEDFDRQLRVEAGLLRSSVTGLKSKPFTL